MKPLKMEDRNMERTVWSLPGLSSDMVERRMSAKRASAEYTRRIDALLGKMRRGEA